MSFECAGFAGKDAGATHDAAKRSSLRMLYHTGLLVIFATVGAVRLVWPQWIVSDNARAALAQQRSQEGKLEARLALARSTNQEILAGQQKGRSAFSEDQIAAYPALVRSVADKEGARVVQVGLIDPGARRERSFPTLTLASDERLSSVGEVQPRIAHIVLTGSFQSLYRTIGTLCQQPQLMVPDGFEIGSGGFDPSMLRVDFRGTVFVVQEPDEAPDAGVEVGPMVTQAAAR